MPNPFTVLNEAVKRVPFMRFALAVAGLTSVVSIIFSTGVNFKLTIIGIAMVLVFMTILFLLSSAAKEKAIRTIPAAKTESVTLGPGPEDTGTTEHIEKYDSRVTFRGPIITLLWGIVILFLVSGTLFMSCLFFKKPTDISKWFDDPKAQKRDYTLYLKDSHNSQPIDLDDKNILLRIGGLGDIGFDKAQNGAYRFRPFISDEDSGSLLLKGNTDWLFDNGTFEKKIPLEQKDVTIPLYRNPANAVIAGTILRKGQPLPSAIVSTRVDGKTIGDTTDASGEFTLQLPVESRLEKYSITLAYMAGKKKMRESFETPPDKDLQYTTKQ